jgi:transcription factor SFP1
MPGTPAEPNLNFGNNDYMAQLGLSGLGDLSGMGGMGGLQMQMQGNQFPQEDFDFNTIGFGLSNNLNDMTIDEPAKRLFSKAGSMNPQQLAYAIKNGNIPMDGELQKKMREHQLVTGLGGPVVGLNNFPDQENKPFKCPVIGCEKAYKNQNGLKYHKQVSNPYAR